jgi:hypothetical protein
MLSVADGISPTPYSINRQAAKAEPTVIAIVVRPVADKPGFFESHLAGGDRVIEASRTPFCDAARRLLDLGMDRAAVLVMRHAGNSTECLRATIAVAAAQSVEESAHGPVFRRHRTGSSTAVEAPGVRSGDRAGSQDPSRTVGGATAPLGTDSAALLVMQSPTEASTRLAAAPTVEPDQPAKRGGSPRHSFANPAGSQDPSRTVGGATALLTGGR